MERVIDTLFQQKHNEQFIGKEIVKDMIKDTAKRYKQNFPNGNNPFDAAGFISFINIICQLAENRGINISRGEVITEIIKGLS